MRDTIFALATGAGRSAVAIMRVSGPRAETILTDLCRRPPPPRVAALRKVVGADGAPIDQALVLWFPGPDSFTGESVFELQLHGGPAVIAAATHALSDLGARPAEPGEFTRRAFEAGRLDLAQAEAVADLVDAETEAQRRQALAQLGGALGERGRRWRETLLTALAFLEAQIDFPDEDVPADVADRAQAPLRTLKTEIDQALSSARGERVRDGVRMALVGAPNAGKSSLLNALVGRDAAIVNAAPGTTRDVIEAPLIIAGHKVVIADTAGLRATDDAVEAEGVRRARAWADGADLRLWLIDPSHDRMETESLTVFDAVVLTKADLAAGAHRPTLPADFAGPVLSVSTRTPDGLVSLRDWLETWVKAALNGADAPMITQLRHRRLLLEASGHLARGLLRDQTHAELVAEDVRLTATALERLSGRLNPDDVLDRVFSAFCIGK